MKQKKMKSRINIYMEPALLQAVENEARNNFLPVSTFIKQHLYRMLQKLNETLTFKSNEK
jgi:predicted DNA binding CopG/RHH family protein